MDIQADSLVFTAQVHGLQFVQDIPIPFLELAVNDLRIGGSGGIAFRDGGNSGDGVSGFCRPDVVQHEAEGNPDFFLYNRFKIEGNGDALVFSRERLPVIKLF